MSILSFFRRRKRSVIVMREELRNTDRKFGEALVYYPVMIEGEYGVQLRALFTEAQIEAAMLRAEKNPDWHK